MLNVIGMKRHALLSNFAVLRRRPRAHSLQSLNRPAADRLAAIVPFAPEMYLLVTRIGDTTL